MNPPPPFFLAILLVGLVLVRATSSMPLCADSTGVFLGLATDEEAYFTTAGDYGSDDVPNDKDDDKDKDKDDDVAQNWVLVTAASRDKPQHSYDGRYLQVLPDTGRNYPGRGQHLQHAADLEQMSPSVTFVLRVDPGGAGIHTLFLRWTGGDTRGGGDSLYVVLYKKEKKKRKNNHQPLVLVHGQQTVKPTVVPIGAGMSQFTGCCYDMVTHTCPCYTERPNTTTCPNWQDRDHANNFSIQCLVGGGAMTIIRHPEWYLYAGQEAGNVMDFDSEPWDVTCEADGSNTIDSGHDFPSWVLEQGEYELKVYAREDATALDGIYVAGPSGGAPIVSRTYAKGDSTICAAPKRSVGLLLGVSSLMAVAFLLVWFAATRPGKEILGTVLNKPAEAVRYVYVDNS